MEKRGLSSKTLRMNRSKYSTLGRRIEASCCIRIASISSRDITVSRSILTSSFDSFSRASKSSSMAFSMSYGEGRAVFFIAGFFITLPVASASS